MRSFKFFSNFFFTLLVHFTYWKVAAANTPPKILFQSSEKTVYFTERHDLEMPCVAYGTPLPRYRWTLNGLDFHPSGTAGRIEMKTGVGTLLFHSPIARDKGLYQCYAANGIGTAVSDIVTLKRVFINNLMQRPTQVHQVYLDFPLKLTCPLVTSHPPATVHWEIKDADGSSQPVKLSNRVTMNLEGSLHFTNVIPSDAQNGSMYYCVATNPVTRQTEQSSGHKITIHGTTKHVFPVGMMWSSPANVVALTEQNVTLKCIFSGNPTPDVYWARDNFSIPSSKVIQSSFGQELLIPHVNESDEGIYTCIGMNSESPVPVIHLVTVTVESKPAWIRVPRDIEVSPFGTVIINCTAHGVPSPFYRWYINGVDISDLKISGIINNIELRSSEPSILTINNVTLVDQMNVQCNATNKHGYIFADIALNVRAVTPAQHVNTTIPPSLCTDRLGMECVKVKAAGHCNDATVASYCQQSCSKCSSPPIVG